MSSLWQLESDYNSEVLDCCVQTMCCDHSARTECRPMSFSPCSRRLLKPSCASLVRLCIGADHAIIEAFLRRAVRLEYRWPSLRRRQIVCESFYQRIVCCHIERFQSVTSILNRLSRFPYVNTHVLTCRLIQINQPSKQVCLGSRTCRRQPIYEYLYHGDLWTRRNYWPRHNLNRLD